MINAIYELIKVFSFSGILKVFVQLIYFFINFVLKGAVEVAGYLFDGSLNLVTSPYTDIVTNGWNTSLSIANLFFLVLLLAIAMGTILGFENFNYKKALPNLIIIALLINFSLTIGNTIINTTNVFTNFFNNAIQTTAVSSTNVSSTTSTNQAVGYYGASLLIGAGMEISNEQINNNFLEAVTKDSSGVIIENSLFDIILMSLFSIINKLLVIFVYLSGAVFMIYRTFWLWLLLILAPLAWISFAFPKGSKINQQWSKWWGEFIRWSFFAPLYLFFTYLALQISKASFLDFNISSTAKADSYSGGFAKIVQMVIVSFIMIAGVILSDKIGGGGSNFVVNYVNKSKKKASETFKKFMPTQTYGEKLGKGAAQRAAGLLTLGGRVSVPGVVSKDQYRTTLAKEKYDKTKTSDEMESITNLAVAANNALASGIATPDEAARISILLSRHDSERSTVLLDDVELNKLIADPLNPATMIPQRNILRRAITRSLK